MSSDLATDVDALHACPPALPNCNRCGVRITLKRWQHGCVRCSDCTRRLGMSHAGRRMAVCQECGTPLDPRRPRWGGAMCPEHRRTKWRDAKRRLHAVRATQ